MGQSVSRRVDAIPGSASWESIGILSPAGSQVPLLLANAHGQPAAPPASADCPLCYMTPRRTQRRFWHRPQTVRCGIHVRLVVKYHLWDVDGCFWWIITKSKKPKHPVQEASCWSCTRIIVHKPAFILVLVVYDWNITSVLILFELRSGRLHEVLCYSNDASTNRVNCSKLSCVSKSLESSVNSLPSFNLWMIPSINLSCLLGWVAPWSFAFSVH